VDEAVSCANERRDTVPMSVATPKVDNQFDQGSASDSDEEEYAKVVVKPKSLSNAPSSAFSRGAFSSTTQTRQQRAQGAAARAMPHPSSEYHS
jgi:hypothetical protein